MNIIEREQQYQILAGNFQAGIIDEATFTVEVDKLGFQDETGCYWMIGVLTGEWYWYDGQTWQPGQPYQNNLFPELKEAIFWQLETMWQSLKVPVKSMFMIGAAFFMILVLLAWPVRGGFQIKPLTIVPSPRPPIGGDNNGNGGGGNSQSDDNNHRDSSPKAAIYGSVLDLSTHQPGAGVEVSVNGSIVRTDTQGNYSITGLSAGQYMISPQLEGRGIQAHDPVLVKLDGQSQLDVKLAYYSEAKPIPTDTPQPQALALTLPPETLPDSGGVLEYRPWLVMGVGLLLAVGGLSLAYDLAKGVGKA